MVKCLILSGILIYSLLQNIAHGVNGVNKIAKKKNSRKDSFKAKKMLRIPNLHFQVLKILLLSIYRLLCIQFRFAFPSVFYNLAHGRNILSRVISTVLGSEKLRSITNRDYFMVGECVGFLFTSCEGSLNERVSAANE